MIFNSCFQNSVSDLVHSITFLGMTLWDGWTLRQKVYWFFKILWHCYIKKIMGKTWKCLFNKAMELSVFTMSY